MHFSIMPEERARTPTHVISAAAFLARRLPEVRHDVDVRLISKASPDYRADAEGAGVFCIAITSTIDTRAMVCEDVLQLFRHYVTKGMSNVATFDGTAYYLQWDTSAALALRQAAPWAKLVLIFREPITRAMSWLQHMNMGLPLVPNCLRSRSMDCCVRQRWFLKGQPPSGRVDVRCPSVKMA